MEEQKELKETTLDLQSYVDKGMSGMEELDNESFKIPFLKILNDLSPEVKKNSPEKIPDADVGMYCNTVTKELYTELSVIVLSISHDFVLWRPNRGGFAGSFPHTRKDIIAKRDGVNMYDAEGNSIVETLSFYLLNVDNPTDLFIFSTAVSSLKYGKAWSSRIRLLKCNNKLTNVSWAGIWKIGTYLDRNKKGEWYTIGNTPKFERFVTKDEIEGFILPMLEIAKSQKVDYSNMGTDYPGGDLAKPNQKFNEDDVEF